MNNYVIKAIIMKLIITIQYISQLMFQQYCWAIVLFLSYVWAYCDLWTPFHFNAHLFIVTWKCHGVTQKSNVFNILWKIQMGMKLFLSCKSNFHRSKICMHPISNMCHGWIIKACQNPSRCYLLCPPFI